VAYTSKGRQGGEGREGERREGVGMGEEGRKRGPPSPPAPNLTLHHWTLLSQMDDTAYA